MRETICDSNRYLISLCNDQDLTVERSKRFYVQEVYSFEQLKRLVFSNRLWSPIIWNDGHNKRTNFLGAYYLCLDLDDGCIGLDAIRIELAERGWGGLLYTTMSHQKEKNGLPPCDRFRVVVRFSEPIFDLAVYEYNTKKWINHFSADRACGSGAAVFRPAMDGVEIIPGEGTILPVSLPPVAPRKKSPYLGSRQIPSWLEAKLHLSSPGNRHRQLYSISATLSSFGFSEDETINIVRQSPLWGQGSDDDSRRTARDGWLKGKQD